MDRELSSTRRSVVPQAAGRSLWLAAAWTGAMAAVVCSVIAIVAVAVLWLPAANGAGSARAAIRAGVLTFLAALHGGITVDGLPSDFVPLGMTILVAVIAWRAGTGLADATRALGEIDRTRLLTAGGVQALVFAAVCGVAAHYATLGTSSVSVLAAVGAGLALFLATGGAAFVRSSSVGDELRTYLPKWVGPSMRAAAAGLAGYLGVGALLVGGSVVLHHQRVEALSHQVGGGWSGVPVLLLGILAAPNAAIAGASYLAGPGFALGSGGHVGLGSTVHATLPAFPVLGAVPSGPATTPAWLLVAVAPAVAGVAAARAVRNAPTLLLRLRDAGAGALVAVVIGLALAWQGGGAIGSGRLSVFGASPWQFGLAIGAGLAVVSTVSLAALAALEWWRARPAGMHTESDAPTVTLAAVPAPDDDDSADEPEQTSDTDGADILAG